MLKLHVQQAVALWSFLDILSIYRIYLVQPLVAHLRIYFLFSCGEHPCLGFAQKVGRSARGLKRSQAAGSPDLRSLENLWIFEAVGAATLELAGDGPNRRSSLFRQIVDPILMLVGERERSFVARPRIHAPAEFRQNIIQVILSSAIHHSNNIGRIAAGHKRVD
jgi:hypothetical protein